MEDIVRPNQAPPSAPGFRAPASVGINQGVPAITIGDGPSGQTDFGPYARTDEPEDYGWFPRLRVLLAGVIEVVSPWKSVSGSFVVNANVCSVWRLNCQSNSLSLSFTALETPSWLARQFIWAGVRRVATVEVIIQWASSVSGTRTLTLSGVRFPKGAIPRWTSAAGRDVVLIQITSDGELYGFAAGLDIKVPT